MDHDARGEVTRLLRQIATGDQGAKGDLCQVVYADLKRAAQALMRQERQGHTLQPTALAHEALLRLFDTNAFAETATRAVFFHAATRAMRQVLVEHARRRNAAKRGGGWQRTAWDEAAAAFEEQHLDLEQLDAALAKLERLHERQFQVVQLRFFGGLPIGEIAAMLEISPSSVEKDLQRARTFLYGEMANE